MVASISNSLLGNDATRVNGKGDADSDNKSKAPQISDDSKDRGPDVIKSISSAGTLALQLLGGGAGLFQSSSSSQPQSAAGSKPFVGQQLIDTLARNGASEDVIKSLSEQAKKDQRVIDSANALKSNFAQQKKGNASQKLVALRQQLKALKQFGGDPKVIARIAADIAREVAAAAQDYADAGQGPVDASVGIATNVGATSGADQASAQNNGQATADNQTGGEASAVSSAGGADASVSSDTETSTAGKSDAVASSGNNETANVGDKEASDSAGAATAEKGGDGPAPVAAEAKDSKDAKGKGDTTSDASSQNGRVTDGRDVAKKALAALIHKATKSDGDKEFAQEVRELLAEAKSILQQALKRAKEEKGNNSELDQITKQFSDAERSAEHALDSILNGKESLFASSGVIDAGESGANVDIVNIQAEAQIQVAAKSVNIVA